MLKLPNRNKLVYLDTNAISDVSKNYKNCFLIFLTRYNVIVMH